MSKRKGSSSKERTTETLVPNVRGEISNDRTPRSASGGTRPGTNNRRNMGRRSAGKGISNNYAQAQGLLRKLNNTELSGLMVLSQSEMRMRGFKVSATSFEPPERKALRKDKSSSGDGLGKRNSESSSGADKRRGGTVAKQATAPKTVAGASGSLSSPMDVTSSRKEDEPPAKKKKRGNKDTTHSSRDETDHSMDTDSTNPAPIQKKKGGQEFVYIPSGDGKTFTLRRRFPTGDVMAVQMPCRGPSGCREQIPWGISTEHQQATESYAESCDSFLKACKSHGIATTANLGSDSVIAVVQEKQLEALKRLKLDREQKKATKDASLKKLNEVYENLTADKKLWAKPHRFIQEVCSTPGSQDAEFLRSLFEVIYRSSKRKQRQFAAGENVDFNSPDLDRASSEEEMDDETEIITGSKSVSTDKKKSSKGKSSKNSTNANKSKESNQKTKSSKGKAQKDKSKTGVQFTAEGNSSGVNQPEPDENGGDDLNQSFHSDVSQASSTFGVTGSFNNMNLRSRVPSGTLHQVGRPRGGRGGGGPLFSTPSVSPRKGATRGRGSGKGGRPGQGGTPA